MKSRTNYDIRDWWDITKEQVEKYEPIIKEIISKGHSEDIWPPFFLNPDPRDEFYLKVMGYERKFIRDGVVIWVRNKKEKKEE